MVVFKQLISSALAVTSVSVVSTGLFFTSKNTVFMTIASPPIAVTARSSGIKKTVDEQNYEYYSVTASELANHIPDDLEDYKCSWQKEESAKDLFNCALLKLNVVIKNFKNKYLDNEQKEFLSGETITSDKRYLLKIPLLNKWEENKKLPVYLKTTHNSTFFAKLTKEFSYSTSSKGIISNIVIGKTKQIIQDVQAKYVCATQEACVTYTIPGVLTEDKLINHSYEGIVKGSLEFDNLEFAVVKFSESEDISFWKSKTIKAKDESDKNFLFTPLYLMVGEIKTSKSDLFVVK